MDAYKETRVFNINNTVIRVHIPDLAAEERSRRLEKIKDAAGSRFYTMDLRNA